MRCSTVGCLRSLAQCLGLRSRLGCSNRLLTEPARDPTIAPNLHVLDRNRLSGVRPLQVQAQGSYRGIQGLDDMQRLDLNCCLKFMEELLDTRERRPWHKRTVEELFLLPFDLHLTELLLRSVHKFNAVSNI